MDADVLILHFYGMTRYQTKRMVYKIVHETYFDVRTILGKYGSKICDALPQLHSTTGWDITAYKFNVGEVKYLRNY